MTSAVVSRMFTLTAEIPSESAKASACRSEIASTSIVLVIASVLLATFAPEVPTGAPRKASTTPSVVAFASMPLPEKLPCRAPGPTGAISAWGGW